MRIFTHDHEIPPDTEIACILDMSGSMSRHAACDSAGNSTAFIEFMLAALLTAVREVETGNLNDLSRTDQVSDQVTDQVNALLKVLSSGPLSALDCMKAPGLSHRANFRKNYLHPALKADLIERTVPEKPNSRLQKYRLGR